MLEECDGAEYSSLSNTSNFKKFRNNHEKRVLCLHEHAHMYEGNFSNMRLKWMEIRMGSHRWWTDNIQYWYQYYSCNHFTDTSQDKRPAGPCRAKSQS